MRRTLLFLAVSIISASRCVAQPVHDYIFSVTGVVTTEDGMPVQGCQAVLEAHGPVYDGASLIKNVTQLTSNSGGFVFMYTSHKKLVKYTLKISKDGFVTQTIQGQAPPPGNHAIRLQKTGANGAGVHGP